MKMHNALLQIAAGCAALLLISGCAETRTEREFGDSVRSVMNKQVYDHGAATAGSNMPVTGGHTGRLEGVIEAHGNDSAMNGDVSKPVAVEIGSNR